MRPPFPFLVLGAILPPLILAGCAAPPAVPGTATLRRTTPAGIGVRVASYARWNERCEQAGLPDAVVTAPPTAATRRSRGSSCSTRRMPGFGEPMPWHIA